MSELDAGAERIRNKTTGAVQLLSTSEPEEALQLMLESFGGSAGVLEMSDGTT